MKNAKIMLSAIVVLAVVGGTLAFRTRTVQHLVPIYTSNGNADVCDVQLDGVLATQKAGEVTTLATYAAIEQPCPVITTTTTEQ